MPETSIIPIFLVFAKVSVNGSVPIGLEYLGKSERPLFLTGELRTYNLSSRREIIYYIKTSPRLDPAG
jgi:hypothetical protein